MHFASKVLATFLATSAVPSASVLLGTAKSRPSQALELAKPKKSTSTVWPPEDWPEPSALAEELAKPAERAAPECLPEGQLVFIHIMKTAGLSVDQFLARSCLEHPSALCAVRRYDGTRGIEGSPKCASKPSICTIHKGMIYVADAHVCGPAFKRAKFFTLLREPITRIWSYYNYIASKGFKTFRERTLKSILANYGNEDLNEGLSEKDRCGWCPLELAHSITHQWFCAHRSHCKKTTLGESKELLRRVDAVIDVAAVERFPQIAKERKLFLQHPSLSGNTSLTVRSINRNKNYSSGSLPDEETIQLITSLNRDEVKLYRYAKTLPTWCSI
eukprot:TRINITY_DN87_c1_g1_i1.p1 TRINITY_DN87_c1_g1~~TRINITY_DN87_c1_g1_i1.p1  ORF type:complete len:352 (+),score=62.09 TRINITY_DN87_c1_g1_i1:64-1056(+)